MTSACVRIRTQANDLVRRELRKVEGKMQGEKKGKACVQVPGTTRADKGMGISDSAEKE